MKSISLALVLTVAELAFVGCSTQPARTSAAATAGATDLGRVAVADGSFYTCNLGRNRICRVRFTALADQRVLVEAVITETDAQGNSKILARPSAPGNLGQKVRLTFGEESISLIPELKKP